VIFFGKSKVILKFANQNNEGILLKSTFNHLNIICF